eukprot:6068110-Pyramimonas_sp.AAC.1
MECTFQARRTGELHRAIAAAVRQTRRAGGSAELLDLQRAAGRHHETCKGGLARQTLWQSTGVHTGVSNE